MTSDQYLRLLSLANGMQDCFKGLFIHGMCILDRLMNRTLIAILSSTLPLRDHIGTTHLERPTHRHRHNYQMRSQIFVVLVVSIRKVRSILYLTPPPWLSLTSLAAK